MTRLYGHRRGFRLLLACCMTLLLTGCMGETQLPKEPVIAYAPVTHDVHYPRGVVIASDHEEAELKAFLAQSAHNPGGNIALMSATPEKPQTAEQISGLRRLLQEWGYSEIAVVTTPHMPSDRIRVGGSKISARAPDCPDWSYAHMANYRNTVLSNFGCAHATNLVRMVEDPNDLVTGTGDSGADATRSSGVIDTYREPPQAPATNVGAQTGGM